MLKKGKIGIEELLDSLLIKYRFSYSNQMVWMVELEAATCVKNLKFTNKESMGPDIHKILEIVTGGVYV